MHLVVSGAVVAGNHLTQGIAHFRANQFREAVMCFDAALAITPDDPYAHWNRATALLSMGDYARGFQEYEWAWRLFHWKGFATIGDVDRLNHLPLWRGERDARVLAYHELGHGDAIMAMRFLDEMSSRAEITLVIDQSLVRLAQPFGVRVTPRLPDDITPFDYRLPFFGVMSALKVDTTTVPAAPYIRLHLPAAVNAVPKIGIAWSGRTQTDFTLRRFLSMLAHTDTTLHSLQPGTLNDSRVEPLPAGSDFVDVAERIARMDAIVTVDTAAAHLAGAMGHPSVHLVLPFLSDWRWHHTELWYPTIKTYRQRPPDDWTAPFALLNEALAS